MKPLKLFFLRFLLSIGEWYEDRHLVGDEGCIWPVEFLRVRVRELGARAMNPTRFYSARLPNGTCLYSPRFRLLFFVCCGFAWSYTSTNAPMQITEVQP